MVGDTILAIGMNTDVITAAYNNAEWCDIVCRTHGIFGAFHPHIWASRRRTPPNYPDAVTLDADATAEHVLQVVDSATPGCSIKDSFARLNLLPSGFRILFEGDWILRNTEQPVQSGSDIRWRRVRDASALPPWEVAWSGGEVATELFRPALLDHAAVVVLGGYVQDRLVAGAILNRSGAAVGVSNLFTTLGDLGDAWPGCLAAVARAFPTLPIVGYESGDALAAAHENGFTSIGRLRVWIKEDGDGGEVKGARPGLESQLNQSVDSQRLAALGKPKRGGDGQSDSGAAALERDHSTRRTCVI